MENYNKDKFINNGFFGGPLNDLMNPRIDQLILYLQEFKTKLNTNNCIINRKDIRKIENLWFHIIQDIDLDTISRSNRQSKELFSDRETLLERIKRTIKNF